MDAYESGCLVSVTYLDPQRIDEMAYLIRFTSDQPTPVMFRVFDEGVLSQTIESEDGTGSFIKHVSPGETPFLEVIDREDQRPSLAFPSRMTLNWFAVEQAESYRIDRYVSGSWVVQTSIAAGPPSFTWQTPVLEDVTQHTFRIVPIDSAGNDGTELELTAYMVRVPDVPSVTLTYSSGTQKVTVS